MNQAEDIYNRLSAVPSDMNEHLPVLRELAQECKHVTEFGVRTGVSSAGFLAGLASGPAAPDGKRKALHGYDINPHDSEAYRATVDGVEVVFHRANTCTIAAIEETDLLLIDSAHNYEVISSELRFAAQVRKYLIFHDTVLFCDRVMPAINKFRENHREWMEKSHYLNNNGLLILERAQCNT